MAEGITLALVGATSIAGESILAVLEQRTFKPTELFLVDGDEGAGEHIRHRGKEYLVQPVSDFDFSQADVTIFAAGTDISAAYAHKAAGEGSYVVDASGHFAADDEVPVVLPLINPLALESAGDNGIVSLPSTASAQLLSVLKPLHDAVGIKRVDVTAMLAVSEMGKPGVDELSSQAVSLFNMREVKSEVFPQQVVFNTVPQVGTIDSGGTTEMERSIESESCNLLGDPSLPIHVSAAWVPVFFGHTMAVHLELDTEYSVVEVERLLSEIPGIELSAVPTAVSPVANREEVFVGRLRQESSDPTALKLWIVADNLRFGIARNVIDIAEILEKSYI